MKNNPQVLHIGFSKCASTYLRALFRGHSQIHLAFKTGFFTPFLAEDMTFEEYQTFFNADARIVNVESDEHLMLPGVHPDLGIRTTNLEQVAGVADKISEYLPDVKLIMIVRNQVSLIVSRYSEYLITGGSLNFENFADALMGKANAGNRYYQNYYSAIVDILEKRFPKEQLLVLLQEEMREDTGATAKQLATFLGLDSPLELKRGLRSERRSLSRAGLTLLAFINRILVLQSSIGGSAPLARVPLEVYLNVVKAVRALDYYFLSRISPGASSVLTANRAKAIRDAFFDDNAKFQRYVGRDLVRHGYLPPTRT